MEIVDAQVHLNLVFPNWRDLDPADLVQRAVSIMDAVGIDAVVFDEFGGYDEQFHHHPGYLRADGIWISTEPISDVAMQLYPDRFAVVARLDSQDPNLEAEMAGIRQRPGRVCLRLSPHPDSNQVELFKAGHYEPLYDLAGKYDLPICTWLPGRAHLLVPYLEKFPHTTMILDHTGVSNEPLGWAPNRAEEMDAIVEMARFPNLALKWSRGPERFAQGDYPFTDVLPHLRKAISAFGVERIMWASDYTQSRWRNTWAEAFHYILNSPELTELEKEQLLGKSARTLLKWPRFPSGT